MFDERTYDFQFELDKENKIYKNKLDISHRDIQITEDKTNQNAYDPIR